MPKPYARWILARRIVQGLVLAAFIAMIWSTRYPLQGFLNPRWAFELDPLVMGLTALAERVWLPGLVLSLVTLAATAALGRAFCGWFCPLGALMDLVAWPLRRLRRPRESGPRAWRRVKDGLLAALAAAGLAGVQAAWFFDPITIFVRAFSLNIHPAVTRWTDLAWIGLLRATGEPAWLEQAYNRAREGFLGASAPIFPHAGWIFAVFALILAAVAFRRRFWCRYLCPLGSLLGLAGWAAPLRRRRDACRAGCSACRDLCRTGAIRTDGGYDQRECILCLDCAAGCAQKTTSFRFGRGPKDTAPEPGGISRAQFLTLAAGALAISAASARRAWGAAPAGEATLRPPGALPEAEFRDRCIRCGNCMKVCPTGVLQPALWETGAEGVWAPRFAPAIGYCEYECNLCGQVCPTGAIRALALPDKQNTPIGLAEVDPARCIPWIGDSQCLVCEEHCPVPEKAIAVLEQRNAHGLLMRRPVVDAARCIGCGACENKCPARPRRAIRVHPR